MKTEPKIPVSIGRLVSAAWNYFGAAGAVTSWTNFGFAPRRAEEYALLLRVLLESDPAVPSQLPAVDAASSAQKEAGDEPVCGGLARPACC